MPSFNLKNGAKLLFLMLFATDSGSEKRNLIVLKMHTHASQTNQKIN